MDDIKSLKRVGRQRYYLLTQSRDTLVSMCRLLIYKKLSRMNKFELVNFLLKNKTFSNQK